MTRLPQTARLHEKVVQQIARDACPRSNFNTQPEGVVVAQRVTIQLVDDLDGTEADETVTFGLDGTMYEVDLSEQNAKELRTSLDTFIAVARRVSGRKKPKATTKGVREWAREQGYTVSDRGVVPAEIRKAYAAAH